MKKLLVVIFFIIPNFLVAQSIKPFTDYSMEELFTDEKAQHQVLEGCISLYSAVTELTRKKYPELASEFYEIANTLYPYGIISLSKTKKISYEEAEKIFFTNVDNLTNGYIDEMNRNGEKNKSYFKGSFIGDDLSFCHEVTKFFNLAISESVNNTN